jgi:tetratricopeptide (TPR) repeat protein
LLTRVSKIERLPPHIRAVLTDAQAAGALFDAEPAPEQMLAEIEHRANLIRALRGAVPETTPKPERDAIEPSWDVLAKLIEETTFLHVYRRAYFVAAQLGLSADSFVDAHRPIIGTHRHFTFIEQLLARSMPPSSAAQKLKSSHLDFAHAPIWVHWPRPIQVQVEELAKTHKEALPNEWGLAARSYHYDVNIGHGSLLAVSPHSPYAMAVMLRSQGEPQKEEQAWEEYAGRSPYLAWSFGEVWCVRGNPAKAVKFLKLAAKLDPSVENYRKLAQVYRELGDDENWLQAWNEFLETPSLGLDHAQVQCEIAQYYAAKRQWDKALPYADAAAESGARWALIWARAANEANQNWDIAEQHYLDCVERYGESPIEWYLFCRRNGVGDVGSVREMLFPEGVEAFAALPGLPPHYAGLSLYLESKPSKALKVYEQRLESAPTTFDAMLAATIADQIGEHAKRDKLLKVTIEQKVPAEAPFDHRPLREELVVLARRFSADLAGGGKCAFDFDELHKVRDEVPVRDRCAFNYFLASYLDRHGPPDLAVKYWKLCMATPDMSVGTRTLAGAELVKRGIKPGEWKDLLMAKTPAKN